MLPISVKRLVAATLTCTSMLTGAGALSGVSVWASDEVAAAQAAGLEPAALSGLSATKPITRAEFCKIALNAYAAITGFTLTRASESPFSDCDDLDIATAYQYGLISGKGSDKFDPDAFISRQDLAVVFANLLEVTETPSPEITGYGCIEDYADFGSVSAYAVDPMVTMVDYAIIGGIKSGSKSLLAPTATATREQALIMVGRFCDSFAEGARIDEPVIVNAILSTIEKEDEKQATEVTPIVHANAFPTTTEEKMLLVYGEGGTQYETAEEAEANMVEISVSVWRLGFDGSKTKGTAYLTVNKNLAHIYEAIFEEIYNGDEKFPIKDVGCYAWRTGEHSQGTAVDINYDENMEATINEDGSLTPTTGSFWTPGADPFSIPEEGDVVRTFKKYGFSWGGDAWSKKRDYMHFSYFGR